jgi:hypothetical protein
MNNGQLGSDPQARPPARRVERRGEPQTGAVFLADCSYSMEEVDGHGTDRRIDRLARVLAYILARTRLQALVCFNDIPTEAALKGRVLLPEPTGGTALHLALDYVGGIAPKPLRCIVLSDGVPNDVDLALAAARRLRPIVIDAYFVGADGDALALDFMRRLSACGGAGGAWGHFDLSETELVGAEVVLRITHQA